MRAPGEADLSGSQVALACAARLTEPVAAHRGVAIGKHRQQLGRLAAKMPTATARGIPQKFPTAVKIPLLSV